MSAQNPSVLEKGISTGTYVCPESLRTGERNRSGKTFAESFVVGMINTAKHRFCWLTSTEMLLWKTAAYYVCIVMIQTV